MRKKTLRVLLSVVMAVSILAGCGESQETMGSAEGTMKEDSVEFEQTAEAEEDRELTAARSEDGEESVTTQPEGYKEVTVITMLVKDLEYDSDGDIYFGYEFEYDDLGNLIDFYIYSKGLKNVIEYDEVNPALRRTEFNSDGSIKNEYEYEGGEYEDYEWMIWNAQERVEREYNDIGRMTKETMYSNEEWKGMENEYDEFGNVIKCTVFDQEGILWYKEYEYDESGNAVNAIVFSADGRVSGEWEYDEFGNLIKTLQHNEDGSVSVIEEFEYEYDGSGNVIKETFKDPFGNSYIAKREYDESGNMIKETSGSMSVQYEYDEFGNTIKEVHYIEESISEYKEYEYEYDSYGNQTKVVEYGSDGSIEYEKEYITITLAM